MFVTLGSLPSRGAWIEIGMWRLVNLDIDTVAPLAGSVDRNCGSGTCGPDRGPSLPSRGAWIEIYRKRLSFTAKPSLPSRGAWIEMSRAER